MKNANSLIYLALAVILIAGLHIRATGLFRGLPEGRIYHPDSPKQVVTFHQYLHGLYVHYEDSLFYDGYPYGLNRVDEALMRIIQLVRRPIQVWLNPGQDISAMPVRFDLYWWGRSFRVFYGLVTILLIFGALRRFGASHPIALTGAFLYAIAPLGGAVSHAVTGDIGVDLFTALGIYLLAGYADTGKYRWLSGYGAAIGMAFSCKYQGALGLWMGGLALALSLRPCWTRVRTTLVQGLCVIAGALVGVLLGTPAFFTSIKRTAENIVANFVFIRDYGVPKEFLEQSTPERLLFGFTHNIPKVLGGFGWAFSCLAIGSTIWALLKWIQTLRSEQRTDVAKHLRRQSVILGIATFPIVAVLLSATMKPAVHPFHFSYILPVMAVMVGLCLMDAVRVPRLRIVILLLLAVSIVEAVRVTIQENFFWQRSETTFEAFQTDPLIFTHAGRGRRFGLDDPARLKSYFIEPADLPVFRNRPSVIVHEAAEAWRTYHQLPIPTVPLPHRSDWVFVNGPVFPRNDRIVRVEGVLSRLPVDRTLVFPAPTDEVKLGLRTGRLPARFRIRTDTGTHSGFLPPHSQEIIVLAPIKPRYRFAERHGDDTTWLVPVRFQADLGPLWVEVLDHPTAEWAFTHYGPAPVPDLVPPDRPDTQWIHEQMAGLRYMEGNEPFPLSEMYMPIEGQSAPLAAGVYDLSAVVFNRGAETDLHLAYRDVSSRRHTEPRTTMPLAPGLHHITWRFEKDFVPFDASVMASVSGGDVMMLSWQLQPVWPDTLTRNIEIPETIADLSEPYQDPFILTLRYPGIGTLQSLHLPQILPLDQPVRYAVRFDLNAAAIPHRIFHESAVFIHLLDANRKVAAALDFPLRKASLTDDRINWQEIVLKASDISPGEYRVVGGLYNVRTRQRFRFQLPPESNLAHRRQAVQMGTVTVTP